MCYNEFTYIISFQNYIRFRTYCAGSITGLMRTRLNLLSIFLHVLIVVFKNTPPDRRTQLMSRQTRFSRILREILVL